MSDPTATPEMATKEAHEALKELSPEAAKVFERIYIETADRTSFLNERLSSPNLPPHLVGEWHGTDDFSQFQSRQRGFVDGSEYVPADMFMHNSPLGGAIGDVKYMVISKQKYDIMQKVDRERAERTSGLTHYENRTKQEAREINLGVEGEATQTRVLRGDEASLLINQAKKG